MAARLVDEPPKRFLGMAELIDETLVGFRLLDCVEVLALNVLDDRDFQRFDIVEIADEGGNLVEPRLLRRPPAPLAGDDLIALTEGATSEERRGGTEGVSTVKTRRS